MKFLTKAWIQIQLKNFADRISDIFAKKTETNEHYTQKAAQSILGHVKLSNSAAITTLGEYALDAIEKNASIEGTLANMISQANSNLATQVIPLELFDGWSGTVTAFKTGNVINVVIESVITIEQGQLLAEIPDNLLPRERGIGFVLDITDGNAVRRLNALRPEKALAISNFDFTDWYEPNHKYSGSVTYVI